MFQAPLREGTPPSCPSVLLISGERVGSALVATSLRTRGHRVFVAETAAQGASRLLSAHEAVGAIVIVGAVRDATPDTLRRWADRHGFGQLQIASIGSETAAAHGQEDGILEILAEDWPHRAAELHDWISRPMELPQAQAAS